MTSGTALLSSRHHASYRRGLGYLLLLIITFGATVGAAHRHGPVTRDRPGAAAVSDAGGSQSPDKGHSQNRECSMCQFQRQLFGGLLQAPLFALTPSTQITPIDKPAVAWTSISSGPQRGRAPPPASLL